MITRHLIMAVIFVAVVTFAYAWGRSHEAAEWRLELAEAREASREASAKLEAQRLASEAQRAVLLQTLEDEARAAPVTSAECFPADRVRRLDSLQ